MTHGTPLPSAEQVAEFWDRQARELEDGAELTEFGTLTRQRAAAALRDRLERAHLERILQLRPDSRVLDLGGGAGRIALWLAPRVAEVTLVDVSRELLAVAEREARRLGRDNLRAVCASAPDYAPDRRYDAILLMNVCCHLDDADVERVAALAAGALAPGGRLYLKEPITSDRIPRIDERGAAYRVVFRPRERYPELFGAHLRCVYQRATCAHLLPWFVAGAEGVARASESPWAGRVLERAAPLIVTADPMLQRLEEAMRARPGLSSLLAPVPVLQDLYVFEAAAGAPAGIAPRDGAQPALSVVVIAYNEALCLLPVVRELRAALARATPSFELVLVDDGSSDATLEHMRILERETPGTQVVALRPNRGIGGALRAGFDAARGTHVTWVPADGQIAPETVVELFRARERAPMVTTVYRARADAWYRHAVSKSLNALIALRTGRVVKSGGNYIFARELWERHAPRDDDTMMISTAFRHNLRAAGERIEELAIAARPRVAGHSKVLNPKTIARTLGGLLRM